MFSAAKGKGHMQRREERRANEKCLAVQGLTRSQLVARASGDAMPWRTQWQFDVFARCNFQREYIECADSDAYETQCRKADCCRHATDLTVFAFGDREFDPRCRNGGAMTNGRRARPEHIDRFDEFRMARSRDIVAKIDAARECLQSVAARCTFDL